MKFLQTGMLFERERDEEESAAIKALAVGLADAQSIVDSVKFDPLTPEQMKQFTDRYPDLNAAWNARS